jgi:CRP-like cAMP-binding protein
LTETFGRQIRQRRILSNASATRVLPREKTATSEDEDEGDVETVESIIDEYSRSEEKFARRKTQEYEAHKKKVQQRLAARRKIRQAKVLSKVPVFAGLDAAATEEILAAMTYSVYEAGHVICKEGEKADRFYVIVSGTCGVSQAVVSPIADCQIGRLELSTLRVGGLQALDVMGENALLMSSAPTRSATVSVESTLHTLELDRVAFEELVDSGVIDKEMVKRICSLREERSKANSKICADKSLGDGATSAKRPDVALQRQESQRDHEMVLMKQIRDIHVKMLDPRTKGERVELQRMLQEKLKRLEKMRKDAVSRDSPSDTAVSL